MQLRQHRLRVKRIDLRRPAVHEQVHHPLRLRLEVRRLGRMGSLGLRQPRQGHHAKASTGASQKLTPRKHTAVSGVNR